MANTLSKKASDTLSPIFRDPFGSFQKEMHDLMTRFRSDWPGFGMNGNIPSVDLSEAGDSLTARVDIPGFAAEEVHVEVHGNVLMVTGEHKEEKKEDKDEKGHKYHFVERRSGSFSRTVPHPAAVKEDKVTADCKDGVLTITMPKKEEAKPHKVKITTK